MLRLLLLLLLALATPAAAHLTPNSVVSLDFRRASVDADLLIPLDQLGFAIGKPVQAIGTPALRRYLLDHIGVMAADGRAWTVAVVSIGHAADAYGSDLSATLRLRPPPGASARRFTLRYDAVIDRVPNHFVMVLARRDFATGRLGDDPAMIGALQASTRSLAIDRGSASGPGGFAAAVRLGMRHIAEGHDHLLFLFTLLLAAPLVARKGRWHGYGGARHTALGLVRVVSAFTVGHSMTLVMGALLAWRLPPRPVEVLIAISILISAIHALRPLFAGREALIAGLFGLVHGLAFAAVMGDLLFDPWEKAQAIFGFNVGIEIVQLCVVAAVLPGLIALAPARAYTLLRIGGGCLAAVASIAWIMQRTFGLLGGVADTTDALLGYAPWLVLPLSAAGGLVLFSRHAWRARQTRPSAASVATRAGNA